MSPRCLSWLVFTCSVLPRLAALCYFGRPDPTYYYHLSDGLVQHGTFGYGAAPTTYIEPLYPALLALARWCTRDQVWLVALAQIVATGIGGVLLFRLTRHLSGSTRAALVASGLYAFYPYLVRQSVAFQSLNVHIPLLLAATWQFVRIACWRRAVACGAVFGLVLLTRASLLPIAICAAAILWVRGQRREMAAFVLSTAAIVGPWTVRCFSVDGSVLPTRIGENLLVSAVPQADGFVPRYDVDLLLPLASQAVERQLPDAAVKSGGATDSMYLSLAFSRVRDDPWQIAKLKATNFAYAFVPRLLPVHPKDPRTRAVVLGGHVVVQNMARRPWSWEALHAIAATVLRVAALAGIVLRWRRRRSEALLLAVPASVILVHTIFFPTTRLLAPMLFALMFYAGCAIDRALGSLDWRGHGIPRLRLVP